MVLSSHLMTYDNGEDEFMGTVTVIHGDQIDLMIEQITAVNDVLNAVHSQDTVLIKPNLVVSRREWAGVNTDPRVVEAIVKVLKARGISRIIVGDGAGMGYNASKAMQICGYHDIAKRYDLKLVDLEKDRFISLPVPMEGPFINLEIAQTVIDCDFLINVPVMKAHGQTLITCSLKNLKGVMPRAMKTGFHGVDLDKAIAQLASVVTPDLIIVDGIQGDLFSETGHNPVRMERILSGTNPVEVDSVVADMLGYSPRTIRHIAFSADAGLGLCDLNRIKVKALNQPINDQPIPPPVHFWEKFPCRIEAEGACSTCMGNLLFALQRLNEKGLLSEGQHFLTGQKVVLPQESTDTTIAVGQCAVKSAAADIQIDKCPPSAGTIYRNIISSRKA
jgi:uncharacterized protein (DUF362 family)